MVAVIGQKAQVKNRSDPPEERGEAIRGRGKKHCSTVFKTVGGLLGAVSGRFDTDTPLPF
jgi:hypothetical protein